jgi:hypothetical protein
MNHYFECECPEDPYVEFDAICRAELAQSVPAHIMINEVSFAHPFELTGSQSAPRVVEAVGLKLSQQIQSWAGKFGVYHIWTCDHAHTVCHKHDTLEMTCVYVGKGPITVRLPDHVKERLSINQRYFISFYECKNRIAKYLEQLFLDIYQIPLNSAECFGTKELIGYWKDTLVIMGTTAMEMSAHKNAHTGFEKDESDDQNHPTEGN